MGGCFCKVGLVFALGGLIAAPARGQSNDADVEAQFLRLCDLACEEINDPARQVPKSVPFYNDSYAVRALCVAYDLTGKDVYLETCRRWADRMLEYQKGMTPKGAYYMNYRRKPGEKEGGGWYVADSSSIAMGVLATAVRCSGPERERYLASVKQFAGLVAKNYIGEAGGVMNGCWDEYAGEWWCSGGLFASLTFLLAEETGDQQYREIGLGAINWLNHLDLTRVKFNFWQDAAPAVMMYVLEGFSAGMPLMNPGGELHKEAMSRIDWALEWMAENQKSRSSTARWDYSTQWGSKLGGLPFHMYVLSRHVHDGEKLRAAADAELRYVAEQLARPQQPKLSQLACFAMMSYAERLRPGAIYRTSRALAGADSKPTPLATPFTERFGSGRLDSSWALHAAKGCAIQTNDAGLEIRAGEDARAHIERALNADAIRVSCTIQPVAVPASASVFICWDKENYCQIGMHRGRVRAREVLGTYAYDYDLGPWPAGEWRSVSIELAWDCLRYLVGQEDGELRSVRVSRRPERFASAPALLVVGSGPETRLFVRPGPFIDPPANASPGVSLVRSLQVVALDPERGQASARERTALEVDERDTLGEQELLAQDDPSFESVSRHFPALKWPREIIGVKDHPFAIGVAHDGSLQFTEDSARIKEPRAFFEIGDPPYRFATGAVPCRRSLLNGYIPVVTLADRHDGLEVEQTAFGYSKDFSPEEPLLAYVRLKLTNPTETAREVPLRWRVQSASGGSPALTWRLAVPAHSSRAVDLAVPYAVTKSPAVQVPDGDFDRKLVEVADYWDKLLAPGSRFDIPEPRVQNAYRAWLAYNFLNVHKRGEVYHVCDGSGFYTQVYGYSAALYCNNMDLLGYHDLAVQYIDSLLTFVRPDGLLHVNFGDTDTGAALWAMSEHYRITRDADWLRRVAPRMLAMCDWIIGQRQKALSQAATQPAVTRGLIRYRPYADLLHPAADYFSNSYLCRGLASTADVLAEIGMTREAARLKQESEGYHSDILASMDAAVFTDRGMEILPAIPDTRELWKESNGSANGYYGIIAPCMLETGIPAANDPKADLLINVLRRRGGLMLGVSRFHDLIDHAYAYGYWMTCLQRDEVKPAILGLYASMACGMTRDTYAAVECTAIRSGDNYWTLPHTYSNTQQLRLLRNLLLREEGPDLLIGWAIPRPWLAPGTRVAVRQAPTGFGPVSFSMQAGADAIRIQLDPPTRQSPRAIKIRVRRPGGQDIQSVQSEPVVELSFKGEVVELRDLTRPVELTLH